MQQQQQQCMAKCTFVFDTFASGCGVGAGTAQARCRNMGTAPLLDPATQQPIDTSNPHLDAQIRALDLAYRPPTGPIMVCHDHYGLVERSQAWKSFKKAGAAAALGALGAAAVYKVSPAGKRTAQQELRRSLLRAMEEKQNQKHRELLQKLEEHALDDPYWNNFSEERDYLMRMQLEHVEEDQDENEEQKMENKIQETLQILDEDRKHQQQDLFEKAQTTWYSLNENEKKECEYPCNHISNSERQILMKMWPDNDNPPNWQGTDAPRAMNRGWAHVNNAVQSVSDMFNTALDYAIEKGENVRRALLSHNKHNNASKYKGLGAQMFPYDPYSQGYTGRLLALLEQKDQYVYSLSTLAMREAIEARLPREDTLLSYIFQYKGKKSNQFIPIRNCMDNPGEEGFSKCMAMLQDEIILSRDGMTKVPNFTADLGWMFDMQSNIIQTKENTTLTERVDATWKDGIYEMLKNKTARSGSVLRRVKDSMKTEVVHCRQEMLAESPKGIPGMAGMSGNTQRYRREITEQYRQSQARRREWLEEMIFLIDAILPRLGAKNGD